MNSEILNPSLCGPYSYAVTDLSDQPLDPTIFTTNDLIEASPKTLSIQTNNMATVGVYEIKLTVHYLAYDAIDPPLTTLGQGVKTFVVEVKDFCLPEVIDMVTDWEPAEL